VPFTSVYTGPGYFRTGTGTGLVTGVNFAAGDGTDAETDPIADAETDPDADT